MQTTQTDRDTLIRALADTYFDFLVSLPYDDELYMAGIKEGKEKFLPNLHIHLASKRNPQGWNEKRYTTDFVSPVALEKLRMQDRTGLDYEHLIPKGRYIYRVLEERARNKTLSRDFVREHLAAYWWTATVTTEEHKRLNRSRMPASWNGEDLFARYDEADVQLLVHKKDYFTS